MERKYLGSGIRFPLVLERGKILYAKDNSLIQQSISIILSTQVKSRVFVPDFGSRIHELLFEPNDEVLEDLLRYFIIESLDEWEKRIKTVDVQFEREQDDLTNCIIKYRILNSNEIDSFIFPYYKKIKY